MRSAPHARAAATAILLALGLSSCSGDPEPIIESSPSASPSASPAPTASPAPDEPESAKAFIRRWQDEAFAMQTTGDTSTYRAMTKNCESCDNFADTIDGVYSSGGEVQIQSARTSSVSRVGGTGKVQIFEFDVASSPTVVVGKDGKEVQTLPGGVERFQVNLVRTNSEWHVVRLSDLVP